MVPVMSVLTTRGVLKMQRLSEHRTHASHLEHQPLEDLCSRRPVLGQETPALLRQVNEYSPGFEQGDRLLRSLLVANGRNFSVGAHRAKGGGVLIAREHITTLEDI